jgi:hypothetical protein
VISLRVSVFFAFSLIAYFELLSFSSILIVGFQSALLNSVFYPFLLDTVLFDTDLDYRTLALVSVLS